MGSGLDDRLDLYLGKKGSYLTVILKYRGISQTTKYQYLQRAIQEEPPIFIQSLDRLYQPKLSKESEVNQFDFIRSLRFVNDLYFNNLIIFELYEFGIRHEKKMQAHFFGDLEVSEEELRKGIKQKINEALPTDHPKSYHDITALKPHRASMESNLHRVGLRIALGVPVSHNLLQSLDTDKIDLLFNKDSYPELERLIQLGIITFSHLYNLDGPVLTHLFSLKLGKHCETQRNYLSLNEWWDFALTFAKISVNVGDHLPLVRNTLTIPKLLPIYKMNKTLYSLLMANATAMSILAHDYDTENAQNLLSDLLQWNEDFTVKILQNAAPLVLLVTDKQLTILTLLNFYQSDEFTKEKFHVLVDNLSEIEQLVRTKKITFDNLQKFSSATQLAHYIKTWDDTNEATLSLQMH